MKYRKKPVIIEAFKVEENVTIPAWFKNKMNSGIVVASPNKDNEYEFLISTLEGEMKAKKGDYIIQGVNGEIYPCKPDIFEKTYELVEG